MRAVSNGIGNKKHNDSSTGRISMFVKRNDVNFHRSEDQKVKKTVSNIAAQNSISNLSGARSVADTLDNTAHERPTKSRYYGSKVRNNQTLIRSKEDASNYCNYKSNFNVGASSQTQRFTNESSAQVSHRDNHATLIAQHTRPTSQNDTTSLTMARKALEHQNLVTKMAPVTFPPLRAPQSIVDVRHPFVTEARTKHNDTSVSSINPKSDVNSLQSGVKELAYARQTFHNYGTSPITGIPSIQNLGNVAPGMSTYVRPDSYGPPTVASVLFPETGQFPHSPPFNTAQVGQLNQYQTYDPTSYATTPVNVNPVMTQYSAESSIQYPQYESPPQFVQTNHYTTSDMTSNQYQYQAAGVSQIQESPLFLQSLQSPIAVTDQYAASNYARAVRAEFLPRLRRPPRFNK